MRGHQLGSHETEYGSDGTLGDAIELVNVSGTGAVSDKLRVEELVELSGEELACVVGMERAHDSDGLSLANAREGIERGDELPDLPGRLRLVAKEVNRFPTRVFIDEHQDVSVITDAGRPKGAGYVRVR